ncbi:mucin-associated surface protein (MASP), partial [Trypanosoma cruzi]
VLLGCCCLECVWCSGLVFLRSLCVDVLLVCAEGYTQVTGVMAMMMTGRVLLVCALCVLWCGASDGASIGVSGKDHNNLNELFSSAAAKAELAKTVAAKATAAAAAAAKAKSAAEAAATKAKAAAAAAKEAEGAAKAKEAGEQLKQNQN